MKLQIGSLFLMFILLSAIFVMPAAAASDTDKVNKAAGNYTAADYFFNGMKFFGECEVVTEGDNLNVRKTPQTGAVIGKLENGSMVEVIDSWAKISVRVRGRNITGWVADRFLNEGYVETEGDNLNVRAVPPDGAVVGKLPNGTLVSTLDSWSRIRFNGYGWVANSFLANCSY